MSDTSSSSATFPVHSDVTSLKFQRRWGWIDAPASFVSAMAGEFIPPNADLDLVCKGRFEWFLPTNERLILGCDDHVHPIQVVRGREIKWVNGRVKPVGGACSDVAIVDLFVHDSGLFLVHGESKMKGYALGLCPRLPFFVCHRLDMAYTKYLMGLSIMDSDEAFALPLIQGVGSFSGGFERPGSDVIMAAERSVFRRNRTRSNSILGDIVRPVNPRNVFPFNESTSEEDEVTSMVGVDKVVGSNRNTLTI